MSVPRLFIDLCTAIGAMSLALTAGLFVWWLTREAAARVGHAVEEWRWRHGHWHVPRRWIVDHAPQSGRR